MYLWLSWKCVEIATATPCFGNIVKTNISLKDTCLINTLCEELCFLSQKDLFSREIKNRTNYIFNFFVALIFSDIGTNIFQTLGSHVLWLSCECVATKLHFFILKIISLRKDIIEYLRKLEIFISSFNCSQRYSIFWLTCKSCMV